MKKSTVAKATICIPSTRTSQSLKKCLQALANQSDQSFIVFIIVKSKSYIKQDLIRSYPYPIHVFEQTTPGLVGAMNTGLHHTNTPYFIRIDDDVVVSRQWFSTMVKTLDNKKCGAVTGPTLIKNYRKNNRDLFYYLEHIKKIPFIRTWYFHYIYEDKIYEISSFVPSGAFTLGSNFAQYIPQKPQNVTNIEACNFAIKTTLLKKLGGFDTLFTQGLGEYHEADIAMKIQKAGYVIVFDPCAVVWHNISAEGALYRSDSYHRMVNFIYFYKRHFVVTSIDMRLRFYAYILFQNCYYGYRGIRRRDTSAFWSLLGTIRGLFLS